MKRNMQAGKLLELSIFAAVATILLTRAYLELSGYPSVGNGTLHIAHAVWGGLFMMISISMLLVFYGYGARRLASVLGGVGFGLFVDELGKFVTQNNDYFFPRTVAIIYVVIVGIVLGWWSIRRRQATEQENLLSAMSIIQDAVAAGGWSRSERDKALWHLNQCDPSNPLVSQFSRVSSIISVTSKQPGKGELIAVLRSAFSRVARLRYTEPALKAIFAIKALVLPIIIVTVLFGEPLFDAEMVALEVACLIVVEAFTLVGIWKLRLSAAAGYQWFARSLLVDILLNQVFLFYRIEFRGLAILAINLLLYFLLRTLLVQKRR